MPELQTFPTGTMVITIDETADHYYIITRGEVEIFRHGDDGETVPLRTLKAGDHFGEIALLKGMPRTANVRTLTPCDLLVFTHDEFIVLLERSPRLRESFDIEANFLLHTAAEDPSLP